MERALSPGLGCGVTWWKVSDNFYDHPKVSAAMPEAGWMWARAAAWSSRYLTNGFVPANQWATLGGSRWKKLVANLVAVGLLDVAEGGWEIHDFLVDNPPKDVVLARRAKRAEHKNEDVLKAVKRRDGKHCRYCGVEVNWRDRRGDLGGTYDTVVPGLAMSVDNVVVSCRFHNRMKGPRTPEQAGLKLLPEPGPLASGPGRGADTGRSEPDLELDLGPDQQPRPGTDRGVPPPGRVGNRSRSGQVGPTPEPDGGPGPDPAPAPADDENGDDDAKGAAA